MKIGILTFHCAHNYGAVLQAFCLQEKLKKLGHDVYVINYRPSYIVDTIYRFSFKCWIFNKWGVQMFYFDSPDQGWDGKYRGKYVDPGVYYYVIEAKGANNKKMKLKGHINILRPKN